MRKYRLMLSVLILGILLLQPVRVCAGETGIIHTTIPTTHSVSIEAEHAAAEYLEGTKGESDAYVVPRFSEPSFRIHVENGWRLGKIWVNDKEVTDQVTDGVLKLPGVYEDQVITIETTKQGGADAGGDTSASGNGADSGQTTAGRWLRAAKTGDNSLLWYLLLGISVSALLLVKKEHIKKAFHHKHGKRE